MREKRILVTGCAGFIGCHLCLKLLAEHPGVGIVGIDDMNGYYPVSLKEDRLRLIEAAGGDFTFRKMDIADRKAVDGLFAEGGFDIIVNLAAQAGVR